MMDPAICVTYDQSVDDEGFNKLVLECKTSFEHAMDDDFNTPEAIASLFEFTNAVNKYLEEHSQISKDAVRKALEVFLSIGNVLTLFQEKLSIDDKFILETLREILKKYDQSSGDLDSVETIMNCLIEIRETARKERQWVIADSIRDDLSCLGFEIQDTAEKTVWRKR